VTTLDAAPTVEGAGLVGRSVARPDVPPKLDGSFEFSNDLAVPGMVFGATVRSPLARGVLRSVDTAPALAMPGVLAAFTVDDVPGDRWIGHIVRDQPVLADGEVRHHGEPIAFVVATSQAQAWRAADAVVVDIEPLEPVTDPELALAEAAPDLHPDGNVLRRLVLRRGDLTDRAPVEVHGTWETGRQDQAFLGPESALAVPDADGGVTVHAATQDLHLDREQVAAALGLPEELVRVRLAGVGGAFGGREDVTCQAHLAMAARALGRPVKTTYRRDESFLAHPQRHPSRYRYTVGADTDGTLRYVRARVVLDGGAYASTSGPVLGSACYFAAGPYRVPAVEVVGEAVRTNNPVAGAMRGFGAVQACFGIESTLDLLAAELGIDPVELRRRNALRPGDAFPTSGQPFDATVDVVGLLDRCLALPLPDDASGPDDDDPYALPGGTGRTSTGEGLRRGVGVALGIKNHLYGSGMQEWSLASVRISAAGAVVRTAATEVGQGLTSALVQVAGDALGGVPVRVDTADSEAGYAGSSSASRQTWMASGAVLSACNRAVEELALVVARRHGVDPAEVALADGRVVVAGRPVELAEALGPEVVDAGGRYDAPRTHPGDPTTGQGDVHVSWMVVAHRAVVDVDTELGLAKVVQVATAQDVGRAVNPREVRGQITGGISQGVGLALTEHLDAPRGVVANGSFTDYLIPTAADVPEVLADVVEPGDPQGPLGLRGAGEPPSLSSTAAVAAALRAATGRPVTRVPARPQDLIAP
jgi:xanthine dehydrogenase D subunit